MVSSATEFKTAPNRWNAWNGLWDENKESKWNAIRADWMWKTESFRIFFSCHSRMRTRIAMSNDSILKFYEFPYQLEIRLVRTVKLLLAIVVNLLQKYSKMYNLWIYISILFKLSESSWFDSNFRWKIIVGSVDQRALQRGNRKRDSFNWFGSFHRIYCQLGVAWARIQSDIPISTYWWQHYR